MDEAAEGAPAFGARCTEPTGPPNAREALTSIEHTSAGWILSDAATDVASRHPT